MPTWQGRGHGRRATLERPTGAQAWGDLVTHLWRPPLASWLCGLQDSLSGACLVCKRRFHSNPGFYSFDPPRMTTKNIFRHCRVPLGAKVTPSCEPVGKPLQTVCRPQSQGCRGWAEPQRSIPSPWPPQPSHQCPPTSKHPGPARFPASSPDSALLLAEPPKEGRREHKGRGSPSPSWLSPSLATGMQGHEGHTDRWGARG